MTERSGKSARWSDDDLESACVKVVAGLFVDHAAPRTRDGWLAPVDWGLAGEQGLQAANIEQIMLDLSLTRAENFLADAYGLIDQLTQLGVRYDDLRRQVTALAIDRLEQEGKEEIQDIDVANGYVDIESRVAEDEYHAQKAWADATQESADILGKMQGDASYQEILGIDPLFVGHARATASAGTIYSAYRTVHDRETRDKVNVNNDTIYVTDPWNVQTPPLPHGQPPAVYADPTGKVGLMSLKNLQYQVTYSQVALEAYAQKTQLVSQGVLSIGLAASAGKSSDAKKAWSDWKKSETVSRTRHIQLIRLINAIKRRAADEPGGPTELGRELASLRAIFVTKLAECLAKLDVSTIAAKRMFCIPMPEPRPDIEAWSDGDGSYLTALTLWSQRLKLRLEKAVGLEGSAVISVSLKLLLGVSFDRQLARAKTAGASKIEIQFQLRDDLFTGYEAIRIAGISAYAANATGKSSGPWTGRIRPPTVTSNRTAGAATASFSQAERWTDLGRIADRNSVKAADINGLAALRNLQPISPAGRQDPPASWVLILNRKSLSGEDGCDLKDIQLDLIVNARAG